MADKVDFWQPLLDEAAVEAAYAAGRHVEYTGSRSDSYQMPAHNEDNSGGWIKVTAGAIGFSCGLYRARIASDAPADRALAILIAAGKITQADVDAARALAGAA